MVQNGAPPTREASLHRKPLTNENFRGLKQKRLLAASTHVNPAEEDFLHAWTVVVPKY